MNDLQKDVQHVLDGMRHFVEAASDLKWHLSDGYLPLVYRSILRRQFESGNDLAVLGHSLRERVQSDPIQRREPSKHTRASLPCRPARIVA